MVSTHVDIEKTEWTAGAPFYGPAAMHQGNDIVQLKILSDRRSEGGGIACLAKFSPPPGKLIKIVATALSDEHVFNLTGGRVKRAGSPLAPPAATRSIPIALSKMTGKPCAARLGTSTDRLFRRWEIR